MDPITLAVIKGSMEQVADEMDSVYATASFSPIISDGLDRASGIYHGGTGEVIVQGTTGLPIFIGVMQFTVQAVLERFRWRPGDICIVNDPFAGGTHLMDIKLVAPYFGEDGEPLFFLANTGHWPDIGGMSPGGITSTATETYQEGVRIPPMLLARGGDVNEEVIELLLANIRGRESDRRGDLAAQIASLRLGAERLDDIVRKFGAAAILEATDELSSRSEQLMRERIREIPDGVYSASDFMDNDGINDVPVKVDVDVIVRDTELTFDFTRTSSEVDGPVNCPISSSKTACFIAIKHLFPDVPINGGCFKPISFEIPEGSFLHPRFPRPVASCTTEAPQRVIDVIFLALSDVLPNVPAPAFSTGSLHAITGESGDGYQFAFFNYMGGGYGGSAREDGLINGATTISIAQAAGVEIQEQRFPVRYRQYAIRPDSEGPGEHRGGPGTCVEIELLAESGKASILGDRASFGPPGLKGGAAAEAASHRYVLSGEEWAPPMGAKAENVRMRRGDAILLRTPGGGGWGDPLARHRTDVSRDVQLGYLTPERAEIKYGWRP